MKKRVLSFVICTALLASCKNPITLFASNLTDERMVPDAQLKTVLYEFEKPDSVTGVLAISGDEALRNQEATQEEHTVPVTKSVSLPSRYNLVDEGLVTSVKDQGSEGLCWAFAAMATAESSLIKKQVTNESIDLSEAHLGYSTFHGEPDTYLPGPNTTWRQNGGNYVMVTATLARGYGLELEQNVPYQTINEDTIKMDSSISHMKNAFYYPGRFQKNTDELIRMGDVNRIKEKILERGAVAIDLYANSYDRGTAAFYAANNETVNHSVTIIGWDDTKVTRAAKPGAFLVKNSWGTQAHNGGIQYLSYYDTSMRNPVQYEFEDTIEKHHDSNIIYQYDETGQGGYSYINHQAGSVNPIMTTANKFISTSTQRLDAVGSYIPADGRYKIFIYKNMKGDTPDTGTLAYTLEGHKEFYGYYTIDLHQDVILEKGETYAVAMQVWDGEKNYAYIEGSTNSNKRVSSKKGQSYLKLGNQWKDQVLESPQTNNFCIKAYASEVTPIQNERIRIDAGVETYEATGTPILPEVIIKDGDYTLIKNVDYVLQYENNIQVSSSNQKARIIIRGIGAYTGEVIKEFSIISNESNLKKNGWVLVGKNYIYYENDILAKNKWIKDAGEWYYLGEDGIMKTNWIKLGNDWYYMNKSGAMVTGWQNENNKWYYLKASGVMSTGWIMVNKDWYYMNKSGVMQSGWLSENNKWYYLKESGAMATGWCKVKDTWYYMNASGVMQTGWLKLGQTWYYLKNNGAMATGWILDGKKYYFLEYGSGRWNGLTR